MSHLSEEELDLMVERERGRNFPPLNDWNTISARLRDEGIIRDRIRPTAARGSWWMQAAAGVLIAAGGIAYGRYSGSPATSAAVSPVTASDALVQPASSRVVSAASVSEFNSADEAWAVLNRAGAEYQKASAYLAANNTVRSARADSAPVYETRLAALDQVMQATHSALSRAPNDPVINQYYLATMGAREATRPVKGRLDG